MYGGTSRVTEAANFSRYVVKCDVCGDFEVAWEACWDYLCGEGEASANWTDVRRANLSFMLRNSKSLHHSESGKPFLNRYILDQISDENRYGPSVPEQINHLIRAIGDHERETGEPLGKQPVGFYARIGAAHPTAVVRLVSQLAQKKTLRGH